ncbi:hypothetical protein YT1_1103 [Rhodococcus ruber]|nr:hypothetical protein YT1_1103 [Rhodococcus ruber]
MRVASDRRHNFGHGERGRTFLGATSRTRDGRADVHRST